MSGGWGAGYFGSNPWGDGEDDVVPGPPTIIALDPQDNDIGVARLRPLTIRIVDDVNVDLPQTIVIVNGVVWVQGGVAVNGAILTSTANAGNGFDLVIKPPTPYPLGSRQEVTVFAQDVDGNTSTKVYSFLVGVGLRLLKVRNPFENTLLAYFNRPLRADADFYEIAHWVVTPVSVGAAPLEIVEISSRLGQPDVAHLRYVGGGSIYKLTVHAVHGQEGEEIEPGYDSALFEIDFGDQLTPTIKLFNSIWGPLGISQRTRTRRKIDDHVANRSLAGALDEQFRLRMQRLDATAGRDGRPGKRRT